ncbi:Uncharacterized protein FKW44_000331, partial [Caligus rogercresseyi]
LNIHRIDDKNISPILLFGLTSNLRSASEKTRAIEFALSSSRSYVAEHLASGKTIETEELRSIQISAAARYSALEIKIPGRADSQWRFAGDLVRYFPSFSDKTVNDLKKL